MAGGCAQRRGHDIGRLVRARGSPPRRQAGRPIRCIGSRPMDRPLALAIECRRGSSARSSISRQNAPRRAWDDRGRVFQGGGMGHQHLRFAVLQHRRLEQYGDDSTIGSVLARKRHRRGHNLPLLFRRATFFLRLCRLCTSEEEECICYVTHARDAIRLLCVCHAIAIRLICLPCDCYAPAVPPPCPLTITGCGS